MTFLENRVALRSRLLLTVLCVLTASACSNEPKDKLFGNSWVADDGGDAGQNDGDAEVGGKKQAFSCKPARASEVLPARAVVLSSDQAAQGASQRAVFTSDLYSQFVSHCGTCHANGTSQGGFTVTLATFAERVNQDSLDRIRSDDPTNAMPRPVKPFSQRAPQDPLLSFAGALEHWIAAGRPADVYYPGEGGNGPQTAGSKYRLTPDVGLRLTNLGNCVPAGDMAMPPAEADAARVLDDKFAAMAALPLKLSETDLSSLETSVLARSGVISFAPGYTLWADGAKKMRHVRVPMGTSIKFTTDADGNQGFELPTNSRFYKTFLKPVTDLDGITRFRKMETRLIVSRPDEQKADGSLHTGALFGTYKWNDDESEATLQTAPYRSGTGFTDDISTYVVDERIADQVYRKSEPNLAAKLLETGATRSYAIPGADRCVHCHMGAPGHSFVLGFTPLQINRRPAGEGGVIEPAEPDELNQLQRFIDYGLITGLTSPDQVEKLEDSQGERKPRNEHELIAQGYMLGNCAHCHNPDGFPSRREKSLSDVLIFKPSKTTGGIFQFPLDRFSPRSFRGDQQNIRIPYITPSLFDHPESFTSTSGFTTEKWIKAVSPSLAASAGWGAIQAKFTNAEFGTLIKALVPGRALLAPWRSLIYRNVDAPFSYEDTNAVFPHMPMDTPGYDCRARRVMGNWMVSIPATWKPTAPPQSDLAIYGDYPELVDGAEQPYVEALPNGPGPLPKFRYDEAVKAAAARLARFQASERYNDCPAPELDVLAPEVSSGVSRLPAPQVTRLRSPTVGDEIYSLPSAARPHYTQTDLNAEQEWVQRRSDWFDILVTRGSDPEKVKQGGLVKQESERSMPILRAMKVTEAAKTLALTEIPFGVWKTKESCEAKLAAIPTVGQLPTSGRPLWIAAAKPPADAHVYSISTGGQVFSEVCSKCHGLNADGVSALANTIADLTGGLTRVADLRNGLFGPSDAVGHNRREFAKADGMVGGTAEDWATRYVAWMGLGGTNATIPGAVVKQIGSATVLGEKRRDNFAAVDAKNAANMLSVAQQACKLTVPARDTRFDPSIGDLLPIAGDPNAFTLDKSGLIAKNGDAALWQSVCRLDNPLFVRVVTIQGPGTFMMFDEGVGNLTYSDLIHRRNYPSTADVGDQAGNVAKGVAPGNLAPWCVRADASQQANLAEYEATLGRNLPRCPDLSTPGDEVTVEDVEAWATRGAANAGMMVYLYLDALSAGRIKAKPAFDRCDDL